MIDNTSQNMNDPLIRLAFLAAAMGPGGPSQAIEEMERTGQAQVVNSDRLPTTHSHSTQEDFEALGFTFGDPDPADPLFRPATLPEGWGRQASDHDMWSYVVDQLGRRRVAIFYKAAPYDRRAFMRIESVASYVAGCTDNGTEVITDDSWATTAVVLEAAREGVITWTEYEQNARRFDDALREKARREAYEALVASLEKAGQA